jgi:hypothetical protein
LRLCGGMDNELVIGADFAQQSAGKHNVKET